MHYLYLVVLLYNSFIYCLQELASKAEQFKTDVKTALARESLHGQTLTDLYEVGLSLDLEIPEMIELEQAMEQTKWLKEVCLCG